MTVERADLSASLSLERMAPVPAAPQVQGQSSPEDEEGKPRRRPPLEDEAAGKPLEEAGDPSTHRIDSLG